MSLDIGIIGKSLEPQVLKYGPDQVILYALGVGAGLGELDFIYEKNLKALPTFAVAPFVPTLIPIFGRIGANLAAILHGEHKIVLHRTIPTAGSFHTQAVCRSIFDKGDKGAIMNWEFTTTDENGQVLFENHAAIIDRSAGGFGGERGPKPEKYDPPEGVEPDFRVEEITAGTQAALYRLSGDKNPLHIDPEFAALGGLPQPILHGLCTYGYAGRAVLNSVLDKDPTRLKSLAVRFMGVVFPGETLITEGWKTDGGYIIRTKTGDGRVVLGNGIARLA